MRWAWTCRHDVSRGEFARGQDRRRDGQIARCSARNPSGVVPVCRRKNFTRLVGSPNPRRSASSLTETSVWASRRLASSVTRSLVSCLAPRAVWIASSSLRQRGGLGVVRDRARARVIGLERGEKPLELGGRRELAGGERGIGGESLRAQQHGAQQREQQRGLERIGLALVLAIDLR